MPRNHLVNINGIHTTGIVTAKNLRSPAAEASISFAIEHMSGTVSKYEWLSKLMTIGILAGFSSAILVMLLAQSRIFYSISSDRLLPETFSQIHPKYRTPYKANLIILIFCGSLAAFAPLDLLGEMTSIGTLFAFIIVCAGVWVLRIQQPELYRPFKVPFLPFVASAGIITCIIMIFGLGWTNWVRLIIWLVIGLIIYFIYGRKHSKLADLDKH